MKKSSKKALEVGAGVAAAAALAAAAGAYLLSGEEGAKRKQKAKVWIAKARAEAAKNIKAAKKISAEDYAHIVNQAIKKYGEMQDATAPEIIAAAKDLKAEWKNIQRHAHSSPAKKPMAKRRPASRKPKKASSRKSRKQNRA